MKVKEIMKSKVIKINPNASVLEAAKVMSEKEIGCIVIEDKGEIGILTERDLLKKIVAKGLNSEKIKVREIMTSPCHTIESELDIGEANGLMHQKDIRRLPVTRDGKIVGVITIRDIAKSLTYSRVKKKYDYSREVSGSSWG